MSIGLKGDVCCFSFFFLFLMAKKLRSAAYLLGRKLHQIVYEGSLEAYAYKPHSAPPNDDVAKLRVRGVDSLLSIYLQTAPIVYLYQHPNIEPLNPAQTCPLTTTLTKTPVTPNSCRLKKTLAVPLTDALLQTIRNSTEACPLHKRASRGPTRLARVRR